MKGGFIQMGGLTNQESTYLSRKILIWSGQLCLLPFKFLQKSKGTNRGWGKHEGSSVPRNRNTNPAADLTVACSKPKISFTPRAKGASSLQGAIQKHDDHKWLKKRVEKGKCKNCLKVQKNKIRIYRRKKCPNHLTTRDQMCLGSSEICWHSESFSNRIRSMASKKYKIHVRKQPAKWITTSCKGMLNNRSEAFSWNLCPNCSGI